jgi:hypothetical protein
MVTVLVQFSLLERFHGDGELEGAVPPSPGMLDRPGGKSAATQIRADGAVEFALLERFHGRRRVRGSGNTV